MINLIGGIVIGMINGEGDIMTIINTYSVSTVGDGLMSQIPALLISVATGMIVTRSASDADLNSDVLKQFSSQPRVLIMASPGHAVSHPHRLPGHPGPADLGDSGRPRPFGPFPEQKGRRPSRRPLSKDRYPPRKLPARWLSTRIWKMYTACST